MRNGKKTPDVTSGWSVVDLFSGAAGISYGFHMHPRFALVGAADAELGKPSTGFGALGCNRTYRANTGVDPVFADLSVIHPTVLRDAFSLDRNPTVLIACPPCTGFSRTIAANHLRDDPRNSLVARMAGFVKEFQPTLFIMENARELISGKFSSHYGVLRAALIEMGYQVDGSVHVLNRFGLPQCRERAIIVASRSPHGIRTLDEMWDGYQVVNAATHVRRAIGHLPPIEAGRTSTIDPLHTSTALSVGGALDRLKAIPHDGG